MFRTCVHGNWKDVVSPGALLFIISLSNGVFFFPPWLVAPVWIPNTKTAFISWQESRIKSRWLNYVYSSKDWTHLSRLNHLKKKEKKREMLLFHSRSQLFPDLFWGAHHSVMHEKPPRIHDKTWCDKPEAAKHQPEEKGRAPRVYKKCCFVLILQNIFWSMMSSPKVKSGEKNKWERNPGICPRTQSLTGSYWFEAIRSWKHQWTHGCVVRLSTSTPWDVRSDRKSVV